MKIMKAVIWIYFNPQADRNRTGAQKNWPVRIPEHLHIFKVKIFSSPSHLFSYSSFLLAILFYFGVNQLNFCSSILHQKVIFLIFFHTFSSWPFLSTSSPNNECTYLTCPYPCLWFCIDQNKHKKENSSADAIERGLYNHLHIVFHGDLSNQDQASFVILFAAMAGPF